MKGAAQAGDDLVHPGASRFPRLPQHARSVRVAGEAMKGRLDACRLESLCVRPAVAEDVVLCDENVRRRDPRRSLATSGDAYGCDPSAGVTR